MSSRSYLSIGDVLATLRDEFPDVTISKIRFLESQGLVNPQRSPSGYRKFYDGDIERLRWVLRQQREHFLPLKVIKDRLEAEFGATSGAEIPAADRVSAEVGTTATSTNGTTPPTSPPHVAPPSASASQVTAPNEAKIDRSEALRRVSSVVAALQEGPEPYVAPTKAAPVVVDDSESPEQGAQMSEQDVTTLSTEELLTQSQLTPEILEQCEAQGLIAPITVAGERCYSDDALVVAKLVAAFGRYGLEPRHLRAYRNAADRELDLIAQVVTPLLRQRTPEARRKAAEHASELAKLGQSLRAAQLRRGLHQLLGS